ncbi:25S rRNA (adenine645-N1)-methyltransferase NDAI_0A03530 [Naumovozyma dairenensis CBS 421]|uniref:Ribosomal RNA-processing protein 8 n=1 Tax=Naumovozyma dairenensis (strain ATCC 10597 / BCRC 20456 / CBS 421 / NBRC 0211 / NRRL Y-12639) TaxID=1071378 RepID=G0W3X2_NAUDC|nr:hypothetical protein NDAI_0A03530 [Naumovozyma dairenensis CBS 421]CCD22510.1 hypothetical protein NDAI_0A03530 [Naumovozyma dairenensis CBS 421]
MELFKVDGWNIKTDKVAFAENKKKKLQDKKNKKAKANKKLKDNAKKKATSANSIVVNPDVKMRKFGEKKDQSLSPSSSTEIDKTSTKRNHEEIAKEDIDSTIQSKPQRKLTPLQQKMMAKLTGSRFRWINEQFYTIDSGSALDLVKKQPELFDEYHDGFRSQVQSWPENPIDVFVNQLKARSQKPVNAPGGLPGLTDDNKKLLLLIWVVVKQKLALEVNNFYKSFNQKNRKWKRNHEVHSFDLKKVNDRITVADIKNVPLPDNSCTIVIFCLSLMGTNFLDFIKEAYRILAPRGELWIAEIKSRFADGKGDEFVTALKLMGFFHKNTDDENKMFTRFEFFKPAQDIIEERKAKLERRQKFIEVETEKEELEKKRQKTAEGKWLLKPCIYKRR